MLVFSPESSNLIGTDTTGTQATPNSIGIALWGTGNVVGGATTAARNLIAYNAGPGVQAEGVSDSITGNTIADNGGSGFVVYGGTGTRIEDNSIYGNTGPGVWVQSDPFGSADPFGPFSDRLTTGIAIQGNSIYANGGLGITLGTIAVDVNGNPLTLQQVQDSVQSNPNLWDHDEPSNKVILNDSLGHVGANNYQNFPV